MYLQGMGVPATSRPRRSRRQCTVYHTSLAQRGLPSCGVKAMVHLHAWPMRGTRIGEAAQPGPPRPVRILAANTTRWTASWQGLLAAEPDLILAQEARLEPDGLEDARRAATRRGWQLEPGEMDGGTALLAAAVKAGQMAARPIPLPDLAPEFAGRLQLLAVHGGAGRTLLLLNVYGRPGGPRDLPFNTQLLLEGLAAVRSHGRLPAAIILGPV